MRNTGLTSYSRDLDTQLDSRSFTQAFHMAMSQKAQTQPRALPFHLYAQTRNSRLYPFTKLMCFPHSHASCPSPCVPRASVASTQLSQPQLYYSFSSVSRDTGTLLLAHSTARHAAECKPVGRAYSIVPAVTSPV